MKTILITVFMLFIANAHASIEFDGKLEVPSESEMARNRACFEDLLKLGCGDPGEDQLHFHSCLHDVYPTLRGECKRLMDELYKRKD